MGAAESPPKLACQCNSQVVLIEAIQPKHQTTSGQDVIAGKVLPPTMHKEDRTVADPLQENDAWANFRKRNGMSTGNHDHKQVSSNRELDGPITSRFNDQDKRIDQIQQKLDAVTKLQQEQGARMDNTFEEVKQHVLKQDQRILAIDQNMEARFAQQQKQQEQHMQSVQAAIESSTKANEDQFRVLRDMLMKTAAATPVPSRKAPKTVPGSSPLDSDKEM